MRPVRLIPLGVLVLTVAIPAVVLGGVWQYADANIPPTTTTTTTTIPPEPVEPLTTPLLSYRRHPTPIAERVAADESAAAYAARVATLTEQIPVTSCLLMVDGDETIAEVDAATALIPASNAKVLVSAVALDVLGPEFRYRTELWSLPPVDGVVAGDVYLVGGGDPVLRSEGVPDPLRYPAFNTTSLDALAEQLVRIGIRSIQGDIVGDGSRYDDEFRAPSWGREITNADAGPYDALLVNDGIIENGNYGLVPARSAAVVFTDLVRARGIEVVGGAANDDRVVDPALTALAVIESQPLPDILVELLHTSDNNTAEMLVKEIGYQARGEGTRSAGLDVIRERLVAWGVPVDGVNLADGSGLSRENRVSCETLVDTITVTPVADQLLELFPVAGRDGTLADELLGTSAEGRLRAKTGTLTDVKALTGTQPAGDDSDVSFALILNGTDVDEPTSYQPIWVDLVQLIEEYPIEVAPDVDPFEPR
jgi:D-alanyl-D-alanine carboxypeptidase/D-alanyl-D-alanine-endopeptidase (penicillin-binding protein 4)